MKRKILTANIAFGLKNMDNLFINIWGHLVFHGWSMIALFLDPKSLRDSKSSLNPKRIPYIKNRGSLESIINLVKKENPDILMLNEIIKQVHSSELEKLLYSLGFKSINFGYSAHHDDATVGSLIASKSMGEKIEIKFAEGNHVGGGGGIAAFRLFENNITIVAVHMCSTKFGWLYEIQVEDLAKFIANEQSLGREIIIGGDWNASTNFLQKYPLFSKLNLKNSEGDIPSCPTFFKKLKPLDHIFLPQLWKINEAKTVAFGSDHLAVSVTTEL